MSSTDCTRCKGKGYGSWVVQHGICFACNGKGTRAAQIAQREAVKANLAYIAAIEEVSITIEADGTRAARHAYVAAFAYEGVPPIFVEVEPGLFAAPDRLNVEGTLAFLQGDR